LGHGHSSCRGDLPWLQTISKKPKRFPILVEYTPAKTWQVDQYQKNRRPGHERTGGKLHNRFRSDVLDEPGFRKSISHDEDFVKAVLMALRSAKAKEIAVCEW